MLLLDSGNFSATPTTSGTAKTVALLDGMEQLGYQAVNVGEREIRSGYEQFLATTKDSSLPFVSANILRQSTGAPLFPPHLVVEAGSTDGTESVRIGVIGVVRYNPLFLKPGPDGDKLVIGDPREAVRTQLAALAEKDVDLVVLLAALHKEDVKRLIGEIPDIDYVLGSYGGAHTSRSELVGSSRIQYCGNRGQRISESRVFLGGDATSGRVAREQSRTHFLTAQYPSHAPMLEFVNGAVSRIASPPAGTP